ncbi:hypothetical protein [Streptomyces sp. NBC_01767]|uniref:hypothetical protein n=1 Tax=Streptomyces sp. NBC_01767 TaxID=2975937 RepID=UPI0022573B3A|nr:hypothetical protein [Streptomyces sp. NBC_01767]MCX4395481.1 hypothetical protein [Streptomyces sp. NBC_01767]
MACLVLTAGATLGAAAGEVQAGQRAPGGAVGQFSAPVAPAHTSGGPSARTSGDPGAGPPAGKSAGKSAGKGAGKGATPSTVPTAVPPDGGQAAPAPPGSPLPSAPASGSPADSDSGSGSATASAGPTPSDASDSGPDSDSGSTSDAEPPAADAQSPLAGREAGEGRSRPGRQLSPWELAHADGSFQRPDASSAASDPAPVPAPAETPAASTSPGTDGLSPQALDAPTVRRVKQVSLGAGIALIGMGLGFLAFRMRRAD